MRTKLLHLRAQDSPIRAKYNMSETDYDVMFHSQGGKCAVCGRHQKEFRRRLNVDHDHSNGHVRGLLCTRCNTLVGLLEPIPTFALELARQCVVYLEHT